MKNWCKSNLVILVLVIVSCESTETLQQKPVNWSSEQSTKMNQEITKDEDIAIQVYCAQHENWVVEETGSGLRFIRLKEGTGNLAQTGNEAKISYSIRLLDGTICYETPSDELDVFKVDKSDVETGIQEGIKKMRVGEKAVLIIPSHLAHGLIGDLKKIPPITSIVVTVELKELI